MNCRASWSFFSVKLARGVTVFGAAAISAVAAPAAAQSVLPAPGVEIPQQAPAPTEEERRALQEGLSAEEKFFTEETWRALVEGKTLYYMTPFGMMGREYYPPGGNRAVFEYDVDKRCFDGSWSEQNGLFCFNYDGQHCFEHLKRGDDIIAREVDGDEQIVIRITDEVLSCSDDLLS